MSPLVWDLAHIAAYEDLWLVHRFAGEPLLHPELAAVYDAFETPRTVRGEIELLDTAGAREYLDAVRARALRALEDRAPDPVLHEMVIRHELQHTETMRQAMELGGVLAARRAGAAPRRARRRRRLGRGARPARSRWAPAPRASPTTTSARRTTVDVAPFRIARRPVTNAHVDALRRGRRLRAPRVVVRRGLGVEGGVRHHPPPGGGGGGPRRPRVPRLLVRGRRLRPRARCPPPHRSRVGEGGDLEPGDQRIGGPLAGVGQVWEWTASPFGGYPGFVAYPYREYSEVFFGDGYRVLRGGSWATAPRVATRTFRNWDLPQRRQIFSGVRLAKDA